MAKASTSAKPTKKTAAKKAASEPVVSPTPPLGREILPIRDPQYVGLTTYDARDPNTGSQYQVPTDHHAAAAHGGAERADRAHR